MTVLFAVVLLAIVTVRFPRSSCRLIWLTRPKQWYYSAHLVSDLRSSRLEVIALLKSKEFTQVLLLYSAKATSLAARVNIVNALALPSTSENFTSNWMTVSHSFSVLLSNYPDVLYVSVQNATLEHCYLNITTLEGNRAFEDYGVVSAGFYSRSPILDGTNAVAAYNALDGAPGNVSLLVPAQDRTDIGPANATRGGLFLGPLMFNSSADTLFIASLTVPVFNNTTTAPAARNVLGYMTVVFNLHSLLAITRSTEGLGRTGQVLIVGPENRLNRWDNSSGEFHLSGRFQYVLPPKDSPQLALEVLPISRYPVAMKAWRHANGKGGIAGVDLDTWDAFGVKSSVGY